MSSIEKQDNKTEKDDSPETPKTLPLLLGNQVLFPMSVVPLRVSQDSDIKLIDESVMGSKMLALVARKPGAKETRGIENAFEIGCTARVLQLQRLPDGSINVVLQALRRFRIAGIEQREPYYIVKVQVLE